MAEPATRSEVARVWQDYWQAHGESLDGAPPRFLMDVLLEECAPAPGRRILEAGSGTGGLAQGLAREGADVFVLDIVPACIQAIARKDPAPGKLSGAVGDLFHCPFTDDTFDVVFNSGVMEHFEPPDFRNGLLEMARVLKPGGKLLCLVPSARGRFYVRGKRRMEREGTWEYGAEYPQRSLRQYLADSGLAFEREYEIGVKYQVAFTRGLERLFARLVLKPFHDRSRTGAALFGGYLLTSVWRKPIAR